MIKANFELYAPIKGFEGLYEVSTWGNVRSLDRWIVFKNGKKYFFKGKILKNRKYNTGYLMIVLYKNGKVKTYSLHRLVAEAFIPNPDNLPCVNHKDEDKTNNYPYNLEWCTVKYNNNYGTRNERAAKANTNGKRSKKVYQYNKKGNLIKIWVSASETGRNGFNLSHIVECCNGNRKTHKGYIWSYEELS